ncbi:MAG: hypothetical protein AB7S48_05360 [Bacteroidales bacterium]
MNAKVHAGKMVKLYNIAIVGFVGGFKGSCPHQSSVFVAYVWLGRFPISAWARCIASHQYGINTDKQRKIGRQSGKMERQHGNIDESPGKIGGKHGKTEKHRGKKEKQSVKIGK